MVKGLEADNCGIIDHVQRYRLTLLRILVATGIVSGDGEAATKKSLERLKKAGRLYPADSNPGDRTEHQYHFVDKSVKFLEQDPIVAGPLKHDMRIEATSQ
ncbi:MAG: hypothetical protein NT069_35815 [Planctomycetota bacterium]|nr:hypothetical protein [Planctomycetota bacterium]